MLCPKVSRLWGLTVPTQKLNILSEICVYPNLRWKWNVKTPWIDERLKWPKECQIEGKTSTDFVNSKFLDVLWNAADIARDAGSGGKDQVCQNTIQITQVQNCQCTANIYSQFTVIGCGTCATVIWQ